MPVSTINATCPSIFELERLVLPVCHRFWNSHPPWNLALMRTQPLILLQMQDTVGFLEQVAVWVTDYMHGMPVFCDVANLNEPLLSHLHAIWNGQRLTEIPEMTKTTETTEGGQMDKKGEEKYSNIPAPVPVLFAFTEHGLRVLCNFWKTYRGHQRLVVVHDDFYADGWQALRGLLIKPNTVLKVPLLSAACVSQCLHAVRAYLPPQTVVRQLLAYAAGDPRTLLHCLIMQQFAGTGVVHALQDVFTTGNTLLLQGPPVQAHYQLRVRAPHLILDVIGQIQQCPAVLHVDRIGPNRLVCTVNLRRAHHPAVQQQWAQVAAVCDIYPTAADAPETECRSNVQMYLYLNYPVALHTMGMVPSTTKPSLTTALAHVADDFSLADVWAAHHCDASFLIERTTYETGARFLRLPPDRTLTFPARADYAPRNPLAPETIYYEWLQRVKRNGGSTAAKTGLNLLASPLPAVADFHAACQQHYALHQPADYAWVEDVPALVSPAYVAHWYVTAPVTPMYTAMVATLQLDILYQRRAHHLRAQTMSMMDPWCMGLTVDPYWPLWELYIPTNVRATAYDDFVRYSTLAFHNHPPELAALQRKAAWPCNAPCTPTAQCVAQWFTDRSQYDFTIGIAWKLAWAALAQTSCVALPPKALVNKIVVLLQAALRHVKLYRGPQQQQRTGTAVMEWPRCLFCPSEAYCKRCWACMDATQTIVTQAKTIL